jgi:hypothetical protein
VYWGDAPEDDRWGDGGDSFTTAVCSRREMERDAAVYGVYLHLVAAKQPVDRMRKLSVLE